ncbi:MAG: Zn-ribbon domain-containing OB-fold protein [Burkholderiales bacterium]
MTLFAQDRVLPAPFVSPEVAPFFEGTAAGRLMLKHCDGCNRVHYYPRAICPHCFSAATRWVASAGLGRIYTYSVSRLGVPVPFAIAYVELDEGVTLMSNLVDCDLDALAIGQRVQVVFKPTEDDGPWVPMFTPLLST